MRPQGQPHGVHLLIQEHPLYESIPKIREHPPYMRTSLAYEGVLLGLTARHRPGGTPGC